MATVTDEQVELVRALICAIPAGSVATYGDVASAAGLSSARTVGWILRIDGSDLPWHRVVPATGRPAAHLHSEQLARLRAEGVLSVDGKVDLRANRHRFPRRTCTEPEKTAQKSG